MTIELETISCSELEIAEFQKAFSCFDKDSNGAITAEELGIFMLSVGKNLTKSELHSIFDKVYICNGKIRSSLR